MRAAGWADVLGATSQAGDVEEWLAVPDARRTRGVLSFRVCCASIPSSSGESRIPFLASSDSWRALFRTRGGSLCFCWGSISNFYRAEWSRCNETGAREGCVHK